VHSHRAFYKPKGGYMELWELTKTVFGNKEIRLFSSLEKVKEYAEKENNLLILTVLKKRENKKDVDLVKVLDNLIKVISDQYYNERNEKYTLERIEIDQF